MATQTFERAKFNLIPTSSLERWVSSFSHALNSSWWMLTVFIYLYWAISPLLSAPFAQIEDHNIVDRFDLRNSLSFRQMWQVLISTDYTGFEGRFAPLFQLFKNIETFLWGNHPLIWRASRFFGALLLAFTLRSFFMLFLDSIGAIACTLLFFSGRHLETWRWIGCAEFYAFAFWLLGLCYVHRLNSGNTKKPKTASTLAYIFFWLWFGSLAKEPLITLGPSIFIFCFFVLPLCSSSLAFPGFKVSKIQILGIGTFLLGLMSISAAALAKGVSGAEKNVLSRGIKNWFTLFPGTKFCFSTHFLPPLLILILGSVFFHLDEKKWIRNFFVQFRQTIGIIVACFVIFVLPQWLFYGNLIFEQGRYMTVSMVFPVAAAAVLLRQQHINLTTLYKKHCYYMFCLCLGGISVPWAIHLHRVSMVEAQEAKKFQDTIGKLAELRLKYPKRPVLLCTDGSYVEIATSIVRFLRHRLYSREKVQLKLVNPATIDLNSGLKYNVKWAENAMKHGNFFFLPSWAYVDKPDCCVVARLPKTREWCPADVAVDFD